MKFCPLQTWEAASETDPKKGREGAQGPARTSQGKGNRKKTRRGAPGTNARGPKGVRSHLLGDKRQANTRVQPTRGGPKASTKTRRGEGRGASQSQTPKPETQTHPCNRRNLPQRRTKQQSDSLNRSAVRPLPAVSTIRPGAREKETHHRNVVGEFFSFLMSLWDFCVAVLIPFIICLRSVYI